MPVSIVVLAAGQGKRMNSALPKVLQPLAGRPMLAHVLETARELTPAAVYVVHGHGGALVRERFADADADVQWCLQEPQLGTGHAVARALPAVPDDHRVLVLCGDVPLMRAEALRPLVADADFDGVSLLTARLPDPTGYGRVLRDAGGEVTGIVEQRDATGGQLEVDEINTGLMALPAGRLKGWLERLDNDNSQGEYYLTDVIAMAVADGVAVRGVPTAQADDALGINDRVQLAAAERSLQRRLAERVMRSGATLADPARLDVRGTLEVGRDVFIDVGAVFEGEVALGDGVRIGPYSIVRDSRIGDSTVVHGHSVIERSQIGDGCEIGPFARLRPGNELAASAKIGNFVEVKNSIIGSGSKVSHLSYVGDTTMGSTTNIGAGTVTCNYDGAAKHRTTIGDGVFVGSGVMLVAPLIVGDGATIGAGSTLSKDAPAGELSIARSRQTTVKGWKRPVKRKQ